ncbi:MAG: hypothetical protein GXX90_00070, partial [Microbacteriaceae bacterium]|nr:hypothetical protein [Microbacteriaceae bacterium]
MWGLFRKRNRDGDDADAASSPPVAHETEEIALDDERAGERDLGDGVAVGEHPSAWVDEALSARSEGRRRAEEAAEAAEAPAEPPAEAPEPTNPFAPLGLRETGGPAPAVGADPGSDDPAPAEQA